MVGEYMSSALYGINKIAERIRSRGERKLVKLLNEYEEWKGKEYGRNNYKWIYKEDESWIYAERLDGSTLGEEEGWAVIICRGYCFVKWLFDNNKIDLGKYTKVGGYTDLESLLMLLSIDDDPISFLIYVLK